MNINITINDSTRSLSIYKDFDSSDITWMELMTVMFNALEGWGYVLPEDMETLKYYCYESEKF